MRQKNSIVSVALATMMIATGVRCAQERQAELPAESYLTLSADGAWCWFSDPRAIYYEGEFRRTYAGWVDSSGNIIVAYYDHDRKEIESHILHDRLERDDHDNPSLIMDDSGRLMVFYSKHSTGNSPIFLARAVSAENISAWETTAQLRLNDTVAYAGFSNTYTYTNMARLSKEDNKMYLFWRGADFKPNVSTSADDGVTWERGKILILPERIYRDRRPYMKIHSNNEGSIHFAFTDGHPNAEPTNSIYYMRYEQGGVYKADRSKISDWDSIPVDPEGADIVYDARHTKEKAWIWDIAENANGNPVLVFATFPSDTVHQYYYSVYDGKGWRTSRLANAGTWFPHTPEGVREREPYYSGGIVLDHNDPSHVYLSRKKDGVFEIEHWSTNDNGATWTSVDVTRNSKYDNVRPFVVRNHPDDGSYVLWMNVQRYLHYTDYKAAIKISISPTPGTQEIARN